MGLLHGFVNAYKSLLTGFFPPLNTSPILSRQETVGGQYDGLSSPLKQKPLEVMTEVLSSPILIPTRCRLLSSSSKVQAQSAMSAK